VPGIGLHGADRLRHERLRQALGHGPPVLDDVGDPGGHAHVVLEDPEHALLVPDHVDARHVDPDAARGPEAPHAPVEVGGGGDQRLRHDPVGHDALLAVDVVQEALQGPDPLLHAALDDVPLAGGDHPGHDVEREGTLLPREVEGHAPVQEGAGHGVGAGVDVAERQVVEDPADAVVAGTDLPLRRVHLVVGRRHGHVGGVVLEQVGHVGRSHAFRGRGGQCVQYGRAVFRSGYPAAEAPPDCVTGRAPDAGRTCPYDGRACPPVAGTRPRPPRGAEAHDGRT
jgi:hypothetical protein